MTKTVDQRRLTFSIRTHPQRFLKGASSAWNDTHAWPTLVTIDDNVGDVSPLYHVHAPRERNPPELTKLTLVFYLRQLLPEDWDGNEDVKGDDIDDIDDFTLWPIQLHVYDADDIVNDDEIADDDDDDFTWWPIDVYDDADNDNDDRW